MLKHLHFQLTSETDETWNDRSSLESPILIIEYGLKYTSVLCAAAMASLIKERTPRKDGREML
jgi:hypothetical protein